LKQGLPSNRPTAMPAASATTVNPAQSVLCVRDIVLPHLAAVLARFGVDATAVPVGAVIDGSYWGEREAGLIGNQLYLRVDTPLQSVLHEACHYVCMDGRRRTVLNRDAGGDYDEENAVCYLQILLADFIDGFGRDRMLADMDAWGYTFRLGSARAWFEQDAKDARQWLVREGLIDETSQLTWRCRN
jgi:hypothetical protein